MTGRAAASQVRQMRQFRGHPAIEGAVAMGEVSESWADKLAEWTRKLPEDWRHDVDKLLADAAAAGANLEDLAIVARAAYEKWRSQQPDPDEPDDRFDDRYVKLGTTIDNAGRLTGDLTPECTAAVQAVLDALGEADHRAVLLGDVHAALGQSLRPEDQVLRMGQQVVTIARVGQRRAAVDASCRRQVSRGSKPDHNPSMRPSSAMAARHY